MILQNINSASFSILQFQQGAILKWFEIEGSAALNPHHHNSLTQLVQKCNLICTANSQLPFEQQRGGGMQKGFISYNI
jgi:hypothetical protein